jgi:glycogen(starch) synthase
LKILILSWHKYPHVGGKSTHISNLIDGYLHLDSEAQVLTSASSKGILFHICHLLISPLKVLGRTRYKTLRNKLNIIMFSKKIKQIVKNNSFDIINAQDALSAVAAESIKRKYGLNVITTMHTYFGIENSLDDTFKKNSNLYNNFLQEELKALQVSDQFIAVDKRIKHHIIEAYKNYSCKKARNIIAVTNFTNINFFRPATPVEKMSMRKKYGIKKEDFIVICARRLVEKNGVIYAIKAMTYLRNTNVTLLIVGDGPQYSLIKDYCRNERLNGQVILHGETNNEHIRELYWCADISLVPSITVNGLQEATSITAIESMACGLPTVASEIGGLKELIKSNSNGLLIPEADEKVLADSIQKLNNDTILREHMAKKARQDTQKNYSHIIAAKKYLEIFDSVKRRAK